MSSYLGSVALTVDSLYNHLVALRSGLLEHRWMSCVDAPVLAVFDELLAAAKKLAPDTRALGAIRLPRRCCRFQGRGPS